MSEESNNKHEFITEKVKEKPVRQKKGFKNFMFTVFMAILFGLIASLTIIIAAPALQKLLNPYSKEDVKIATTDENENGEEGDKPEENEEQQKPIIVEQPVAIQLEDYVELYNKLSAVSDRMSDSITKINVYKNDEAWFKNIQKRETVGIILGESDKSYFTLCNYIDLKDNDIIEVQINKIKAKAKPMQVDKNLGVMVLKISKDKIKDKDAVKIAKIGLCADNMKGKPVIIYGNLIPGDVSYTYGNIISAGYSDRYADGEYFTLSTNNYVKSNTAGVVADLDGRILGVIQANKNDNYVEAIGINDIIPIANKLSNNVKLAQLGVRAVTFKSSKTEKDEEGKKIQGVFVKEVMDNSPAMKSGIQPGDIITKINEREIKSINDLQNYMQELRPNQIVQVSFYRQNFSELTNIVYEIELK